MSNKGGRPGVGPKRDIRMSDDHWQVLKDIGRGNAAAGLRRLIELHVAATSEAAIRVVETVRKRRDSGTKDAKRSG